MAQVVPATPGDRKSSTLQQVYQGFYKHYEHLMNNRERRATKAIFLTVDEEGRRAAGKPRDAVSGTLVDGQLLYLTFLLSAVTDEEPLEHWMPTAMSVNKSRIRRSCCEQAMLASVGEAPADCRYICTFCGASQAALGKERSRRPLHA